jgi:plastocyanin
MYVRRVAVLAGASVVLALACGGGERQAAPPAGDLSTPGAVPAGIPAEAPGAAPGATPAAGVAPAPITGTIHEVRMVGDEKGYRYEPATIAAQPGDGVKFVMASFGPHNVAFDPATIPADQRDQLYANMPNSEAGVSPMLMDEAEVWELSLGNLKPGRYPFYCTPHLAMNMTGEIIIQ